MKKFKDTDCAPLADILREELKKRAVRFTFYKKDGTLREAYGTRNPSVASKLGTEIPSPKTGSKCNNENAFYDLTIGAWRSFCPFNIVSIDD